MLDFQYLFIKHGRKEGEAHCCSDGYSFKQSCGGSLQAQEVLVKVMLSQYAANPNY